MSIYATTFVGVISSTRIPNAVSHPGCSSIISPARSSALMLGTTWRGTRMTILTRMCTSLDGHVTTPDGLPVQLAFSGWDAGALGFYELQGRCDAVLMGRTTFEPALGAPHWPWGDLGVYVLGSRRPPGTPERVVVDDDPVRL